MRELLLRGVESAEELTEAQVAARATAPADVPEVLELAAHPHEDVRWGLAAVLWVLPEQDDDGGPLPAVVDAAVALSADAEPRVRDWACFTLAQLWTDLDAPALRDALAARLADPHDDTRCEALLGLALRRDERALPAVRAALQRPRPLALELQAAGALGDPELHPLVAQHQDGWDEEDRAKAAAALRLTDPSGLGDDVLDGVAELYRRRAHGEGDGEALTSWHLLQTALELAPHRAAEAMAEVESRLLDDPTALAELHERSALAVEVGLAGGS